MELVIILQVSELRRDLVRVVDNGLRSVTTMVVQLVLAHEGPTARIRTGIHLCCHSSAGQAAGDMAVIRALAAEERVLS